jgi:dTDP-4-dehydrorhamnose reductase
MKKILVTGASGLLGLNIAVEVAKDFDVYGVAHHNPIQSPDLTILSTDLLTPGTIKQIFNQTQPDWVIHCAALTDLDACAINPKLAKELNANLPGHMAEETAKRGARFVHISTDAVFDGKKGSYVEKNTTNPLSIYARTKLAGEQAVAAADPESIVARVNFYGWSLSGQRSLGEFFFNNLREGNRVNGFADVFFSPLLANDLAQIVLHMLEAKLSGLYHIFSSDAISKYDFGVAIAERFGLDTNLISPISVEESGLIVARSPNLSMRTDKLTKALGDPPPSIASGLDHFFELFEQKYPQKLTSLLDPIP